MDIFVGNLSFDAKEGDVKELFEDFGNVSSVVIVMSKEKKVPRSRGFGFVQVPDSEQALAAIVALNGREFMGRPLNVSPARPKTEAERESKLKKKAHPKFEAKAQGHPQKEGGQGKSWFSPVFNKRQVRPLGEPGTYKGGRRTRSYMSRRGLEGMQEEPKPRKTFHDNPLRWRKNKDQAKPWQKSPGENKPWKKPAGGAKPWSKSSGRAQKSGFKPAASLGTGPERIEGRGRSKVRRRPGGYKR